MKNRTCFRGDVYLADLGQGIGSEQSGVRPWSFSRMIWETNTAPR